MLQLRGRGPPSQSAPQARSSQAASRRPGHARKERPLRALSRSCDRRFLIYSCPFGQFPEAYAKGSSAAQSSIERFTATGATALTGAKACKCKSESCNITRNIFISTPARINSTYKHPPAQGEIGRVGSASIRGRGVTGATATAQRTEMRGDDMNMICTYGHRKICGKMGDQS